MKKMAEDLTDYLLEAGVRARDLHSEINTLDRIAIIRELRLGEYDVLVGVNLLREGLDLPRGVARRGARRRQGGLPARQDGADPDDQPRGPKHGRKGVAVCRQAHRGDRRRDGGDEPAARVPGRLQRRARDHPRDDRQRRVRHRRAALAGVAARPVVAPPARKSRGRGMSPDELEKLVITLEEEMYLAAEELRFEYAAKLRDEIKELRRELQVFAPATG